MRLLKRYESGDKLTLALGDLTFSVLVIVAARSAIPSTALSSSAQWGRWTIEAAVVAIFIVMFFYYIDLYALDREFSINERVLRLFMGFGGVCMFAGAITNFAPELGFQEIHLIDLALVGLGLVGWHQGFARALKNGRNLSKVLIVGTQTIGRYLAEELHRKKYLRMEVIGFIGSRLDRITLNGSNLSKLSLRVFPRHSILHVVESKGVNRILVAGSDACANFPAQDLVALRLRGIRIEDCHSFSERVMGQIPIADLEPGWVVLSEGFRRTRWIHFTKRAMDLVLSVLGLILWAPIFLLTAIAIKLDSDGPVFYSQERVGLDEQSFTVYKFRSMVHDAEEKSGPVWAEVDDPRVTRVGRFIRTFRLDELPQLVNVLKGEMSLVGPRPERPFFVSKFKQKVPYYHLRFSVKPGITGWAQIYYAYAATEKDAIEKLQYELYYIKNHSPLLDLQILFATFKVLLLGRGAQ
jgi:sugar transferase (PEP-CTERM system associated)